MPPMPETTVKFFEGIMSTGYFLPVLAGTEVIGGLMLLTGIASPLGLIILAPVTLHVLLFHIFLTPGAQNLGMPIVMVILHLAAIKAYWPIYRPLFAKKPIL